MADDYSRRDDTVKEEAAGLGQRIKGATKDGVGSITGNDSLEREGERENAVGRARQANNDVFDETDGVPQRTVTDDSSTTDDTPGSILGLGRIEPGGGLDDVSNRTRPADGGLVSDDDRFARGAGDQSRGFAGTSGSVAEEASATGERAKGATKDAAGSLLGLNRMEREGELENASGRARQAANDVDLRSSSGTTYGGGHFVTGLYDTPEHAGHAYNDLTTKHGYKSDDVSVLMSDDTRQRHFGDAEPGKEFKTGSKAAEGAGVGGATGISVGAVLGGLLAAATSIAIPGLGLVVAGPIAGAIAGAGAGGAAGTLIGALIGAGIPEERAKVYDEGIRSGGIVLGTRARDEEHAAQLERDFTTRGGRQILR